MSLKQPPSIVTAVISPPPLDRTIEQSAWDIIMASWGPREGRSAFVRALAALILKHASAIVPEDRAIAEAMMVAETEAAQIYVLDNTWTPVASIFRSAMWDVDVTWVCERAVNLGVPADEMNALRALLT